MSLSSLSLAELDDMHWSAREWFRTFRLPPMQRYGRPAIDFSVVDPAAHDGEWPAFITLPHETVEWDGLAVPLFEGDVERREWEERRRARRR